MLVDARPRPDLAARRQRRAREQIPGLRAVDISLQGLLIIEPLDEQHFFTEFADRGENLAQLHRLAGALRPPFLAVKAVAGEQHGEADGSLARASLTGRLVTPDRERLQPRERHRDAQASKQDASAESVGRHRARLQEGRLGRDPTPLNEP